MRRLFSAERRLCGEYWDYLFLDGEDVRTAAALPVT